MVDPASRLGVDEDCRLDVEQRVAAPEPAAGACVIPETSPGALARCCGGARSLRGDVDGLHECVVLATSSKSLWFVKTMMCSVTMTELA